MTQGDDGPAEKRASTAPETADHGSSIIQFSADAFYCRNTDGSIEVDVVRIGDVHSAVVVDYETEDGSARGGEEYARTIGSVMFSEGEYIQKIRVQVASSKIWRPTLYFMIRLNAAGSSGGAFKECRVWILHQGAFPAAEFGGSDGGTPSASGMTSSAAAAIFSHPKGSGEESHLAALAAKIRLLYAFYKKCFAVEVVGKGTLKMLAVDSLDNLLFLWQLVLSVFFVDHVLTQLRLDDVARTQAAVLPCAPPLPCPASSRSAPARRLNPAIHSPLPCPLLLRARPPPRPHPCAPRHPRACSLVTPPAPTLPPTRSHHAATGWRSRSGWRTRCP